MWTTQTPIPNWYVAGSSGPVPQGEPRRGRPTGGTNGGDRSICPGRVRKGSGASAWCWRNQVRRSSLGAAHRPPSTCRVPKDRSCSETSGGASGTARGGTREADVPAQHPEAGQEPRLPSPYVDPRRARHHQGPPAQGSPHVVSLSPGGTPAPRRAAGTTWRIRDRTTFSRLRHEGRRSRCGPLGLTWLPGAPSEPPRVAYAVGRSVGPAVVRNKVRRRLRALVASVAADLAPGSYLIAASPRAAGSSYGELRSSLCTALRALASTGRPS